VISSGYSTHGRRRHGANPCVDLATARLPVSSRAPRPRPKTKFKPIDKSGACFRNMDVRRKGKSRVMARAVRLGELVARESWLLQMSRTFVTLQQAANTLANTMPKRNAPHSLQIYSWSQACLALYSTAFETFAHINHRVRRVSYIYDA